MSCGDLANALAAQAHRTPERVAVSARDGSLTYAQLDKHATELAHELVARGAGPQRIVALFTGRTTELVIGIIGILKAGAAYLPVVPEHPGDRTKKLITIADPVAVVTTSELVIGTRHRSDLASLPSVVIGELSTWNDDSSSLPRRSPSSLAYVLATSGSTGEPKGVLIEDRNVLGLVHALAKRELACLGPCLRIAMVALSVFDASVQQIFSALLLGHTLVIVPEQIRADGHGLRRFWAEESIDVSDGTPAHLRMIAQARGAPQVGVRHLIIGGDVLNRNVLREFVDTCAAPGTTVTNIYGVSECCVDSVSGRAEPFEDGDLVPIGTELPGTAIDLLDQHGRLVPDGEVGEIRIKGTGVGPGYLGQQRLTAERFGDLSEAGGRYYLTGDLAQRLPDGRLLFLGRADRQIKLRGHRIELGEIEAALRGFRRQHASPATPVACTRCLLTSAYPGVTVVDDVCDVCRQYDGYRHEVARYFGDQIELVSRIREYSTRDSSGYDVLLLFSGGKDSSYALYRLLDLGFRVLAFTFDNGFISQAAFKNIERITMNAGVDLEIGRVPNMNAVFVDSLRSDSTVCSGCFRGLTAMSTTLAVERKIGVVATGLSRGQIFDTKLRRLFEAQIRDPAEIDQRLVSHRKMYHARQDRTAKLLALPIAERSIDDVLFLDYFRYDDIDTLQIKEFLKSKDPLWAEPADTGLCSTNCRINEVGIYVHSLERGYHNYASPLSWDCRLGVLSREQGLLELSGAGPKGQVEDILRTLGYVPNVGRSPVRDTIVVLRDTDGHEPYLCAYYTATEDIDPTALRGYLATQLPAVMVPSRYQRLDKLPVTDTGKVAYESLPKPACLASTSGTSGRLSGETEERLAEIWADVLGADQVSRNMDFFLLGGDSLMATIVAGLVEDEFKVPLTAADLFAVPTVADGAILIEKAQRQVSSRRAPRRDSGDSGGIVLLPDVLGSVDMYRELAGHLPAGVSTLPGRNLLGSTEIVIEGLGTEYAERVLSSGQTSGYRLGGWSFGGTIAPEVARQISARGGHIEDLIVIDAMPPDKSYWQSELRSVEEFLKSASRCNALDKEALPAEVRRLLRPESRPDRAAQISYARAVIPVLRALSAYEPADDPVARCLTYIRAAGSGLPDSAERGWRRFCQAEFRSVTVPGDHFSIFEPPQVNQVARLFTAETTTTGRGGD